MEKTDTHFYDGKLISRYEQLLITEERNKKLIEQLVKHINDVDASKAINLIIRSIGTGSNYDKTNDVYADKLLFSICEKLFSIKNKEIFDDILDLLKMQLSDIIKLGSCPEGRCTRLAQIFFILDTVE